MAKQRIGAKAQRVFEFLIALGHPRAQGPLVEHGFTEADLDEGWARLRALSKVTVLLEPETPTERVVSELDAWENRWFPIADAVLRTNHPEVHAVVFHKVGQTEGPQVIVSVRTLLDRLESVARDETDGGLGEDGRAACELLQKRGLTDEVIAEARELLARVGAVPVTSDDAPQPETRAEVEQRLWNWYLEWSSIARVAIRDQRVLRSLGFRRPGRRPRGVDQ